MASASASAEKFKKSLFTSINRAKQLTTEKLGRGEKTEFDADFVALSDRSERLKIQLEKILKQIDVYLQPNPNRRLEASVYEKLHRKPREHTNELEALGLVLSEAAVEVGDDTSFGKALNKVGQAEIELGERWNTLQANIHDTVGKPIRHFLASDLKELLAERKTLNTLRLDLDAAKNKLKKASPDKIDAYDAEAQTAQEGFDKQYEITRILLESVTKKNQDQINRLVALLDAQNAFFAGAAELTATVANELRRVNGLKGKTPSKSSLGEFVSHAKAGAATARVTCHYEALDSDEMSVKEGEVVIVRRDPSLPAGWVLVEREGKLGKVPMDYLDLD